MSYINTGVASASRRKCRVLYGRITGHHAVPASPEQKKTQPVSFKAQLTSEQMIKFDFLRETAV